MAAYLVIGAVMVATGAWRALRMMPTEDLPLVAGFALFAALLCVAATLQMRRRATSQAHRIDKLIAIQAYLEGRDDWDWHPGADAPVGFGGHADA